MGAVPKVTDDGRARLLNVGLYFKPFIAIYVFGTPTARTNYACNGRSYGRPLVTDIRYNAKGLSALSANAMSDIEVGRCIKVNGVWEV